MSKLQLELSIKLSNYVANRLSAKQNSCLQLVSVLEYDHKRTDKILFTNALISNDAIILPYIAPVERTDQNGVLHIDDIIKDVENSSSKVVSNGSIYFADYLNGGISEIKGTTKDFSPIVCPIIITSTIRMTQQICICKKESCRVVGLSSFLSIVDEVESINELSSFLRFLKDNESQIIMSDILDQFAAFKEMDGVIVEGATEPSLIWLQPNWGISYRFRSLANFWSNYPSILLPIIDDARSMAIFEAKTYTRVYERNNRLKTMVIIKVGMSQGLVYSPIHEYDNEAEQMVCLTITECIADYINRLNFLHEHPFFRLDTGYLIYVYSKSTTNNDDGQPWKISSELRDYIGPSIRITLDIDAFIDRSYKELSNDMELELIANILQSMNTLYSDKRKFENITHRINNLKGGKPRFGAMLIDKNVSYPEHYYKTTIPKQAIKEARKHLALLAKQDNIAAGTYAKEDAKRIIDKLKQILVEDINVIIERYDYDAAIQSGVSAIEGCLFEYGRDRLILEKTSIHSIDYDSGSSLYKNESELLPVMNSAKYLLEKIIQLHPTGTIAPKKLDLEKVLSLASMIIDIQRFSDMIAYGIDDNIQFIVSEDYTVKVLRNPMDEQRIEHYGKKDASLRLGKIGNKADRVNSVISDPQDYILELDEAFKGDFEFRFSVMTGLLNTLAQWAIASKSEEKEYYKASRDKIISTTASYLKDGYRDENEIQLALEFLELHDVLNISGSEELAADIPIWEYNKRHNRYGIKPIIKLSDDTYCWGPNSAYFAMRTWVSSALELRMPSNIAGVKTCEFLARGNAELEKRIEEIAAQIVMRFTKNYRRNLKSGKTHPSYIGEYDVLAYLPKCDTVLNIECKDIKPPFCHKDARRLREKIYGHNDKIQDDGYLKKVESRAIYLKQHLSDFDGELKWGFTDKTKVISVFVTRYMYYWTEFPIRNTDVIFVPMELLEELIKKMVSNP